MTICIKLRLMVYVASIFVQYTLAAACKRPSTTPVTTSTSILATENTVSTVTPIVQSSAAVFKELSATASATDSTPAGLTGGISVSLKHEPGATVFPAFNDFDTDEAGWLLKFNIGTGQQRRVLVVVEPLDQSHPPGGDAKDLTRFISNCSITGAGEGNAAATLSARLDFPPLRVTDPGEIRSLQSSCVLEENDIYVQYSVQDGLQRLKWPGAENSVTQSGRFTSFHATWWKPHAARKTSGTRFDIVRPIAGGAPVTVAECSAGGLVPLGQTPTVALASTAPFVRISGLRSAGAITPDNGLFGITCAPPN